MDNMGLLILILRGIMAVALLVFTVSALVFLWKDLTCKTRNNPDKKGKMQRRQQQ